MGAGTSLALLVPESCVRALGCWSCLFWGLAPLRAPRLWEVFTVLNTSFGCQLPSSQLAGDMAVTFTAGSIKQEKKCSGISRETNERNRMHKPAQVRLRGLSGKSDSVGRWAPGVKTIIITQVRYSWSRGT